MSNPRYSNGNLRRKYRARFKAMQAPCGICKGKLGPIHYDEPSDHLHPLSFVIHEHVGTSTIFRLLITVAIRQSRIIATEIKKF